MPTEGDVFFESLYRANFNKLKLYASVQLRDPSGAEEIVQDTFYTALRQLERVRRHGNPEAYLMKVLKYKILEYRRARSRYLKRFLSLEQSVPAEATVPAPSGSASCIMETARDSFTQEEWRLFQRFILDGATHLELSKELGISVWACQKRLERIRKKLREVLPEQDP